MYFAFSFNDPVDCRRSQLCFHVPMYVATVQSNVSFKKYCHFAQLLLQAIVHAQAFMPH